MPFSCVGSYWSNAELTSTKHLRMDQVKNPSSVLMTMEGNGQATSGSNYQEYNKYHANRNFVYGDSASRALSRFHRGKYANVSMLDGHVEAFAAEDFGSLQLIHDGQTPEARTQLVFGLDQ